jgi:hypothetical protein
LTQRGYPWAAVSLLVIGEVLRGPLGATAAADELVLPQAVERKQSVELVYRFDKAVTGHGFLEVEWTDVDSRVIERRRMPLDLADTTEVAFVLDTRRAVTMKNRLAAHSSIDAVDQLGNKFHRENNKTESFIASPSDPPWLDYQIIMWQQQTRAGCAALKWLGVTAGMVLPWPRCQINGDKRERYEAKQTVTLP